MTTALSGKVAFVTGGARGIGAAIVKRLARDAAAVAFTYKGSTAQARALAASIEAAGGRALAIQADAGDATALTQAIDDAARHFGKIDILVNNAGVLLMGNIDSFSLADFDTTLAVNVRAVFVASKAVLPHMGQGGRIINIGSCNAERMPFPGGAAYAMSKSALQGLVQGMARDLGPRGITVNNVQPGPTNTDMNPESGDFAIALHGLMALQRHAQPDEIAGMVAYVASPDAAFVTGASLTIDGGFNA
jgi:3-oxoacyl-[acyl-carrier protein] reductase